MIIVIGVIVGLGGVMLSGAPKIESSYNDGICIIKIINPIMSFKEEMFC